MTYTWLSSHQKVDAFENVEVRVNDRADKLAIDTREIVEAGNQEAHPNNSLKELKHC